MNFTPLKLDSINSKWFNYSHLDYLFFENKYNVYFVFEKNTNSKKQIFLKVIDTLGKSTGFIELATLKADKSLQGFGFEFKRCNGNELLIIATQKYFNNTTKKTITLYNLEEKRFIWTKTLPIENTATGYTSLYVCNPLHDLYYLQIKSRFIYSKRKYMDHRQINIPVYVYDSLILHCLSANKEQVLKQTLSVKGLTAVNGLSLKVDNDGVITQCYYSKKDSVVEDPGSYFLNEKWGVDLERLHFSEISPLQNKLKEQLTFYDGSDTKHPSDKEYSLAYACSSNNISFNVCERKEMQFYKELLVWETDLITGRILRQYIVPRKIVAFSAWSRFDNIGEITAFCTNQRLYIYLLEAKSNFTSDPNYFNYALFDKKSTEKDCNLILYTVNGKGVLEKKLLHANADFNYIPLRYESGIATDAVLYLSGKKLEKFAILKLSRL